MFEMIAYNLFIPLFNMEVDENLLGKEFINNFVILPSSDILYELEKFIFANDSFTMTFIKDITQNGPNKWLMHPYAKYVLFKTITLPDDDDDTILEIKAHYKKVVDKILLSLRLISDAYCQVNNLYLLANGHSIITAMQSSSQIENITINHHSYQGSLLVENLYHLTENIFIDAQKEFDIIDKLDKKIISIPSSYFHKCYNSQTPSDKILNLAIVLESTMLAGKNQELNYRLFLRTSAFLEQNVKKLLETFYTLRSEIVHNGTVPDFTCKKGKKDIYDTLVKITGLERNDCTELIFYFIKDHIEPIVRKILKKSFNIFATNKKIKTYEDLNAYIEKFIIEKISEGFNVD